MYRSLLRRPWAALAVLLCLGVAVSCGKGGGSAAPTASDTAYVRMINAIPDAPSLTLTQPDGTVGAASFGQSTAAYTTTTAKTVNFSVQYTTTDGVLKTLTDSIAVSIAKTHEIYILMTGTFASPTYKLIDNDAIVVQKDANGNPIPVNTLGVQFAESVDLGEAVDVYLTAYNDTIADSTPVATLNFGDVSPQAQYDAGTNYRIRVTAAGSTDVIYDSGKITLNASTNQIYLLENYFGPGTKKLRVASISAGAASNLVNESLPTELRVANFISNEPNIDLYFGDTNVAPKFDNIAYRTYTDYQSFDPATESINVTPHGDNLTFLYEKNMVFSAGESRTLVLAGDPSSTAGISAVSILDDKRVVATQLQLRFVDASANAGTVDFYVLQPGQPFSDATPASNGASFLSYTSVPVAQGTYDLLVTLHGQSTIIAGPMRVSVDVGAWSAVLTDASSGGPPYELVISEDL